MLDDIILRKLEKKDAILMYKCMTDVDVIKYLRVRVKSIENCENFIENAYNDDKSYHFAIVNALDEWVGTISLKNVDAELKCAEYAIITAKAIHGTGLAYKATMELLKKSFLELGLKRVYLNVIKENVVANKFYNKCGFVHEGTARKSIIVNNEFYDLEWYSILEEDYLNEREIKYVKN